MNNSHGQASEQDPAALQREIEETRRDMAESIDRLRLALRLRFDVRRQIAAHPLIVLAFAAAVSGVVLSAAIRRVRRARRRPSLAEWLGERRWPRFAT